MLPEDLSDVVIELTEHEVYVGDSLLADSLASLASAARGSPSTTPEPATPG